MGRLAHDTLGMSGAEIANLTNEAAILAAKRRSPTVDMRDYDDARLTRQLGGKAAASALSAEEVAVVSVHEAAHAVAACVLEHCDPVRAATIAPRGRALGFVATSPDAERRLVRRAVLEDRVVMCLAGRAGEEVVHGSDMATERRRVGHGAGGAPGGCHRHPLRVEGDVRPVRRRDGGHAARQARCRTRPAPSGMRRSGASSAAWARRRSPW